MCLPTSSLGMPDRSFQGCLSPVLKVTVPVSGWLLGWACALSTGTHVVLFACAYSLTDKLRLKVVTIATNETDGYKRFMRSAKIFGLDVEVHMHHTTGQLCTHAHHSAVPHATALLCVYCSVLPFSPVSLFCCTAA